MSGHLGPITCVDSTIVVEQDMQTEELAEKLVVLSSSADGTLRSWDWKGSGCLKTFDGHSGAVLCVAVSKNGQYAASGGDDCTVR